MKFLFLFLFSILARVHAQSEVNKGEVWGAYISSVQFSNKFSAWNDFHLVPHGFFISRHGLTYHIGNKHDFTGGYAYVTASTHFTNKLVRNENRPFLQYVGRYKISDKLTYQVRLRHDFRFRRTIEDDALIEGFDFYNRTRVLSDLRFFVHSFDNGHRIHLDIMDELLVNYGGSVTTSIDQNRLFGLIGYSFNRNTIFVGYHWRNVPSKANFHGLSIWFMHNIDITKK
jgi:hypothetical protein